MEELLYTRGERVAVTDDMDQPASLHVPLISTFVNRIFIPEGDCVQSDEEKANVRQVKHKARLAQGTNPCVTNQFEFDGSGTLSTEETQSR